MLKKIIITLSLLLVTSCSDSLKDINTSLTENHPLSVSRTFWNIHFSENGDPSNLMMDEGGFSNRMTKQADQKVILGEAIEQNNLYFIQSTYVYTKDSMSYELPFFTIVGSQKGQFKVRYNDSLNSFFEALIKKHNDELVNQLSLVKDAIQASLPNTTPEVSDDFYNWSINELTTSLATQNIRKIK